MKLERLVIEVVPSYRDNAGQYEGVLTFKDPKGEVRLPLDQKLSKRILAIVSDELVDTAKQVAFELTTNCINAIATDKQLALDSLTDRA